MEKLETLVKEAKTLIEDDALATVQLKQGFSYPGGSKVRTGTKGKVYKDKGGFTIVTTNDNHAFAVNKWSDIEKKWTILKDMR